MSALDPCLAETGDPLHWLCAVVGHRWSNWFDGCHRHACLRCWARSEIVPSGLIEDGFYDEIEPPPPSRPRGVVVIGLVLLALGIAVAVYVVTR